jgi:starch synthase
MVFIRAPISYDKYMRVLFVTSEVAGFFKRGGLADVSQALPVALAGQKVTSAVAMPYYAEIKLKKSRCLGQVAVQWGSQQELVFIFVSTLPGSGVPVYLFRHPMLNDYMDDQIHDRFAFFSLAVVAFYYYSLSSSKMHFDVIHCHDWHTALIPLMLGENNKTLRQKETLKSGAVKTVMTIHNLMYQGVSESTLISRLNSPKTLFHLTRKKDSETFNILREGLEYADVISTVSPTYAREITTSRFGEGLHEVLERRRDKVTGILNGIDTEIWNPATDKKLPVTYSMRSAASGKSRIKTALQDELGLYRKSLPVFGFIGRLEPRQKGIDIIMEALDKLLPTMRFQLVVLGTGNPQVTKTLVKLSRSHKGRIAFVNKFDEPLAHRIYAGCDVLLVPSRFEPCGLIQMIAMRYGTIPLVRRTGGLADTVTDGKTGFVFDEYTGKALGKKMAEVIDLWGASQDKWQRIMHNVMAADFSWTASARKYKSLYKKLIGENKS